jgi:hypothetical protein
MQTLFELHLCHTAHFSASREDRHGIDSGRHCNIGRRCDRRTGQTKGGNNKAAHQ